VFFFGKSPKAAGRQSVKKNALIWSSNKRQYDLILSSKVGQHHLETKVANVWNLVHAKNEQNLACLC